jgi:hypothetical protein
MWMLAQPSIAPQARERLERTYEFNVTVCPLCSGTRLIAKQSAKEALI